MSLQIDIKNQVKEAMKAKDEVRLTVIRSLVASFTNELVAKQRKPDGELTDEEVLAIIRRSVKQHKDSIEQFKAGNRADLVKTEEAELVILEAYLPALMDETLVIKAVEAKVKEMGVTNKKEAGKVMAAVMKDLKGKADGAQVKSAVDKLLS
jgi:uncharacterized protein